MKKAPPLTPTQESFCQHHVEMECKNPSEAARRAGVKGARQYAYVALRKPHLLARIEELKKQQGKQVKEVLAPLDVTHENLLREMAVIFRDEKHEIGKRIQAGSLLWEWTDKTTGSNPFAGDDPFAGKSKKELEHFATYGYFPDSLDPSQSRPN